MVGTRQRVAIVQHLLLVAALLLVQVESRRAGLHAQHGRRLFRTPRHLQQQEEEHTHCPEGYDAPKVEDVEKQFESWGTACQVFHRVCIDQDRFVLYFHNRSEIQDVVAKKHLPHFKMGFVRHDFDGVTDDLDNQFDFPEPMVRPHVKEEETPDLGSPHFSTCTVPVVMFSNYIFNFGETFERLLTTLWVAKKLGYWDNRYSIMYATLGQPLKPYHKLIGNMFSHQEVVSLSDASARHQPSKPEKYSVEKTHVRCFETLVMCKRESKDSLWDETHGAPPAQYWQSAQAFAEHYRSTMPAVGVGKQMVQPINSAFLKDDGAKAPGRRLRVVFASRPGSPKRTILNLAEVLKWCNSWVPTPVNATFISQANWTSSSSYFGNGSSSAGGNGSSGPFVGAECVSHDFEDLLLSVALMQQTDVQVGIHGAALVNALFLPKGASVVEIRPMGFPNDWANYYTRRTHTQLNKNQTIFWYGINNVLVANSKPSDLETRGIGIYHFRDRHVSIDIPLLERMFNQIAWVDGDIQRYLDMALRRLNYFNDDGSLPGERR